MDDCIYISWQSRETIVCNLLNSILYKSVEDEHLDPLTISFFLI